MTRFKSFSPLVAAAVAAAMFGTPSQAEAKFELTLKSGAQTFVIEDDKLGDLDPMTGTINVNKVFASGIQITAKITGVSNAVQDEFGNPMGPNDVARLKMTAITVKNAGTGQANLEVWLSDDGFQSPVGSPLFMSTSASATVSGFNSSVGDQIQFQSFYDDASTLYGTTSTTGLQQSGSVAAGPSTTLPLSFSPGSLNNVLVPGSAPFSLTQKALFTLSGGANVTFNGQTAITAAPAPAGLILVASAVPCLGLGFWRRRKGQAPTV